MEYTGKTKHECSVTIHKVTEGDNCTWAVRLEEDLVRVRKSGFLNHWVAESKFVSPKHEFKHCEGFVSPFTCRPHHSKCCEPLIELVGFLYTLFDDLLKRTNGIGLKSLQFSRCQRQLRLQLLCPSKLSQPGSTNIFESLIYVEYYFDSIIET